MPVHRQAPGERTTRSGSACGVTTCKMKGRGQDNTSWLAGMWWTVLHSLGSCNGNWLWELGLDVVSLTLTDSMGSSTKLLDQGWSFFFSGVPTGDRCQSGLGMLTSVYRKENSWLLFVCTKAQFGIFRLDYEERPLRSELKRWNVIRLLSTDNQ